MVKLMFTWVDLRVEVSGVRASPTLLFFTPRTPPTITH